MGDLFDVILPLLFVLIAFLAWIARIVGKLFSGDDAGRPAGRPAQRPADRPVQPAAPAENRELREFLENFRDAAEAQQGKAQTEPDEAPASWDDLKWQPVPEEPKPREVLTPLSPDRGAPTQAAFLPHGVKRDARKPTRRRAAGRAHRELAAPTTSVLPSTESVQPTFSSEYGSAETGTVTSADSPHWLTLADLHQTRGLDSLLGRVSLRDAVMVQHILGRPRALQPRRGPGS